MKKELLKKYFNNSCTEEELSVVLDWFKESAGTSEGKSLLFKLWDEMPGDDSNLKIDFDILLDRIHHEVNLTQSKNLLDISDQNIIKYKRREKLLRIFTRAAAILFFPVLGFGLYMSAKVHSSNNSQVSVNQAYNEVFSSVDAITKVTLPDGSNVWLNHSSSLCYPASFRGKFRTVEIKGEGYFEVAHNPKIPFIVKAGEIQILARGTTFNVLAYPGEDRVETSLINGIVELRKSIQGETAETLYEMKPTDYIIYNKLTNEISNKTIGDDRYFSWREGKLVFNKEPMGVVIEKLGRWFNVDIQINDPELFELTYTATFVDETLPQVLELMTMISPVSYSISNRKMISPGTFTKREVILCYKSKPRTK